MTDYAPPPHVEEVTVGGSRGQRGSAMEQRLGRDDVRLLPGAFGDPYRAIEMLPGVVPTISGLPYYYIRGAPPSAVGYFIDEVRVPYVFHFALGPSVIQSALIDEVSLHPAAFPARYGRYAGAIVAGKTREPGDALRGEGQVRVFDAGAYVETPFANGRVTAGVGARYSYTAALFSLVAPDTTIDYRDYNARASVRIDEHWRATAFAFGAYDLASQVDRDLDGVRRDLVLFASEFHRLDLRLDRRDASGASSRIAATIGFDRSRLEGARFAQDVLVDLRARHGAPVRPDLDVEIGIDTAIDNYSGDLPNPLAVTSDEYADAVALFSPRVETSSGVWASARWHPKSLELTGTARADVFTSAGVSSLGPSPRVSMRVPITNDVTFVGALGIGAQPPAFAIPVPAVGYSRLAGGISYGYQKSAGVEAELPLGIQGRATGFHHSYRNLREFTRSARQLETEIEPRDRTAETQAFGLELFISRRLGARFGAFASYTLSRSELASTRRAPAQLSPFDRTHVFQLGASADLGARWRASLRFLTYRGWPDQVSGGHLPTFVRLDARVEKRWRWREAGYIGLVFEGLNVTAAEETVGRRCDSVSCAYEKIGPIIVPSVGVEGAL